MTRAILTPASPVGKVSRQFLLGPELLTQQKKIPVRLSKGKTKALEKSIIILSTSGKFFVSRSPKCL